MREFLLRREQRLDADLEAVFDFFSDARNLETLTPPWLRFEILTPAPVEMRVGARIDYRLRLHGIPVRWQSEITVWEPGCRFVDEQRRGPYRRWIHTHEFEAVPGGGTVVRDVVRYAVPGGALVNRLFVAPDVARVFDFRERVLRDTFQPSNA
jgi:ligand-binding SRPBCC domain-containing protein